MSTIIESLSIRQQAIVDGISLSERELTFIEGIVHHRLARQERKHAQRLAEAAKPLNAVDSAPTTVEQSPLDQRQEATKQRELDHHWDAYAN